MATEPARDGAVSPELNDSSAPQSRAERQAAYDQFVTDNLRRNYIGNFVHGVLGLTGFRLMYAPTFMPAYLGMLTGNPALVGLSQSLLQLGQVASPIVGATQIENKTHILPTAVRIGSMMRLQILGLAVSGYLLTGTPLLLTTMLFLFLLGVFTGSQRVAFQTLMAKVIPISQRGRLQAYRNLMGGAVAAALSYFAGVFIISNDLFGNGYATTFVVSFVLTTAGLITLQRMMREPASVDARPAGRFMDRVREFPSLLEDRDYRWFLLAQCLAISARVAAPFYILYAGQLMEIDGATIGLLSLAFLGADTVSNLLWGHLGDRFGFRIVFIAAVCLWIGGVGMLLFSHNGTGLFVSFLALGGAMSGYMMAAQTMVLEFGERHDLPMRLALSTTVEGAISTIAPLAGGVIVSAFGFVPLFHTAGLALVLSLAALVFRVREPRARVAPVQADEADI